MTDQTDDEQATYDREREEARMEVIHQSMERALGRGKAAMNPPKAISAYNPHDWINW